MPSETVFSSISIASQILGHSFALLKKLFEISPLEERESKRGWPLLHIAGSSFAALDLFITWPVKYPRYGPFFCSRLRTFSGLQIGELCNFWLGTHAFSNRTVTQIQSRSACAVSLLFRKKNEIGKAHRCEFSGSESGHSKLLNTKCAEIVMPKLNLLQSFKAEFSNNVATYGEVRSRRRHDFEP